MSKLNLVSEAMKHRVLLSLGADVDNLSRSKHGMLVLKGLENVINWTEYDSWGTMYYE